jgi:hypothetical protein
MVMGPIFWPSGVNAVSMTRCCYPHRLERTANGHRTMSVAEKMRPVWN